MTYGGSGAPYVAARHWIASGSRPAEDDALRLLINRYLAAFGPASLADIAQFAGQPIDASTRKPKVNYQLLEKKESGGRASFLYEGTIQSDDGTSFTRKWLVAARKDGAQWRVSNFTESD